jgi:hypothetical protein
MEITPRRLGEPQSRSGCFEEEFLYLSVMEPDFTVLLLEA